MAELDAVHRSGHLNVGEHQIDVETQFQDANCLIRIASFNRLVTGGEHQFHRSHSDNGVVFHRPWVSVNLTLASSWIFTDVEGRITIEFYMENVGDAPATNVEIEAVITPLLSAVDPAMLRIQNAISARTAVLATSNRSTVLGGTIFPNRALRQRISLPLSREFIRAEFGALGHEVNFVTPAVVGAILYRSPVTNTWHQTGFVADIMILNDQGAPGLALRTDNGEIPRDRLLIHSNFLTGLTK